jgi:hypothetical protein
MAQFSPDLNESGPETVEDIFNTMEFKEELDPHSEEYYQRALSSIGKDLATTFYEAAIQTFSSLKFATKVNEEKYAHTSDDIYQICDAYFTTMQVMQQRKTKFSYINVTIKKNNKRFRKTNEKFDVILDSGASQSYFNNIKMLTHFKKRNSSVMLGNNTIIPCLGIGQYGIFKFR